MLYFCFVFIEQRKYVVFGSEIEEGDSVDYDFNVVIEVDVNDKENEFKKVFIVK